jgi:hypothetical protein
MATTETDHAIFTHNSDYSGTVQIRVKGDPETIDIPFEDLKGFVAEYVRKYQIQRLEQLNDDAVLGLEPKV